VEQQPFGEQRVNQPPQPEYTPIPSANPSAPGENKFCHNCGAPLPPNAVFCPKCGTRVPLVAAPDKKICVGCRAANEATAQYCFKCGLKLPDQAGAYVNVEYGGFWIRLGASFIDGLVLLVPTIIVSIPFIIKMINWIIDSLPPSGSYYYQYNYNYFVFGWYWLWMLAIWTIEIAYFTISVGKWGKTIGKKAVGLKIVRTDGSRVSYARALGRSLAYMLNGFSYDLTFLMIAFNAQKRGLHDYIADTIVVKTK
jgi:uncharacterized RDD family membrane protein YckC/ribosomal protein L40E